MEEPASAADMMNKANEPLPPNSKTPPADLPSFAEKAADLEALRKTVEDATSVSRTLWLCYSIPQDG